MQDIFAALALCGGLLGWVWHENRKLDARLDSMAIDLAHACEKLDSHAYESVITRNMLIERLDADRELNQAKLEMIWHKISTMEDKK